jgi:glycine/D-amino acid oxidase-like deaminating enzyme
VTSVAVLGGGILGCLSALHAARAGFSVTLLESRPSLWSEASAVNEGKIHLGPVFALASARTQEVLMDSALSFAGIVEDALETPVDWEELAGDDFEYLVMPDSLLGPDELGQVYAGLNRLIPEGARYLGRPITRVSETRARRDPDTGLASFRTSERAVDPRKLGALVTRALHSHPSIAVRTDSEVIGVHPRSGGRVAVSCAGEAEGDVFDYAINCTWTQQQVLLAAAQHRQKLNYRVKSAVRLAPFPGARTVTLVQGPYGDVVRHGDHVYASWYPVGRLSNEYGVAPSAHARELRLRADGDRDLGQRQIEALRGFGLLPDEVEVESVMSGFIVGHGAVDIDSRRSRLHDRSDFGVSVHDGTVLTPHTYKLTSAPLAARAAVDRLADLAGAVAS